MLQWQGSFVPQKYQHQYHQFYFAQHLNFKFPSAFARLQSPIDDRWPMTDPDGIPRKSLIFQPEKIRDETSLLAATTACSPCWLLFYVLIFYLDLPFALTYFLVIVIRSFIRHFAQTMRWNFLDKMSHKTTNFKFQKKRADPDIIIYYM